MEKTVFRMLAATGVVIGLGMATLPLSGYAADTPVDPCANMPENPDDFDKEVSGNTCVSVNIADYVILDVDGTAFKGGYNTDGSSIVWPEESNDSLQFFANSMSTAGVCEKDGKTCLFTGIQSSVPYSISISAADPVLRSIDASITDTIPSGANVKGGVNAWAIKKNIRKSGLDDMNIDTLGPSCYDQEDGWTQVTTTAKEFQTGPATRSATDDFVPVKFGVGISAAGNLRSSIYTGDVTITAAPQP